MNGLDNIDKIIICKGNEKKSHSVFFLNAYKKIKFVDENRRNEVVQCWLGRKNLVAC